jgi:hypothetical protein
MAAVPRHRIKGDPFISSGTQEYYQTWNPSNSSEQIYFTHAHHYKGQGVDMYDEVNSDFERRRARGEIIMSPMRKRIYRITDTHGNGHTIRQIATHLVAGVPRQTLLRVKYWQGPAVYQTLKGGVSIPIYIEPGAVLNQKDMNDFITEKSTELQNKRGRPDHDIWESVAELDKTVSILPGLLKSLKKATPLVKRSDLQKSISEVWLTYRYGIKPLLADIEGVMKGLNKKVGKIRQNYRATGMIQAKSAETLTWNSAQYGLTILANYEDRMTVRACSIDEFDATQAFNIGFSTKGLLTLPWELTRYSFVVDWFTNIGDFLGAITPAVGFTQLGSCISVFREKEITLSHITDIGNGGWEVLIPSQGRYHSYVGEYQRTPGTPSPGLVIRNDFKFHNIIRSLDALSLLIVQLKGR